MQEMCLKYSHVMQAPMMQPVPILVIVHLQNPSTTNISFPVLPSREHLQAHDPSLQLLNDALAAPMGSGLADRQSPA